MDHEKIPVPRGWEKKRASWSNPPDRATMIKAIDERLKKTRSNPPSETPS